MRAVHEPCEVTEGEGQPVSVRWGKRTYRVTRILDDFRAGGRWWLGEPCRSVWVLECGVTTVEVCRWDEADWPAQGWWVLRVQD